ncbi:unnamed protein product [Trichobilharzia szidati]|nr:unnamed protein product [Trichobilharzia szidati]
MVARLLTLRHSFRRSVTHLRNYSPYGSYKNEHGPSYYLIPEIPCESYVSQNILKPLSISNLEDLKPDRVFGGISKLIMNYQVSLSKLSDSIQSGKLMKNDTTIISALEQASFPVEQAFCNLNCLTSVKEDPIWTLVVSRLYQKLKAARREYLCRDSSIYEALLTLRRTNSSMDEYEKGLLDAWIYECWLMGDASEIGNSRSSSNTISQHSPKSLEAIHDVHTNIDKEEVQFQAMVASSASVSTPQNSSSRFSGRISTPSYLDVLTGATDIRVAESDLAPSAPYWLPAVLGGKEDGGHIAGMHINLSSNEIVSTFLKHCSNSELRRLVWEYWVRRASDRYFGPSTGLHASNDGRIQHLRRLRASLAKHLGCKDWLSVVWSSPYACSPSSPDSLTNDILEPFRTILKQSGERDFKLLREWANANLDLPGKTLEAWDVDYALEQYNYAADYTRFETLVSPPNGSLLNYLHTVFSELAEMFHLKLTTEIPRSSENDMSYIVEKLVYHVEDMSDGTLLGEIIIDPFSRNGRSVPVGGNIFAPVAARNNLSASDSCILSGSSQYPIVYLLGSLNPSSETLGISFGALLSFMSSFGSCLQYVACRVPHHELYSFPHFMALDSRFLMSDLCYSIGVNNALPSIRQQRGPNNQKAHFQPSAVGLRTPPKRIMSLYILRELYESRFDLALWSNKESETKWSTLHKDFWKMHMPYPLHPDDQWPCSCTELFGPNSQAGLLYYRIWRRILLQDVLCSLQDANWLSESHKASEIFKRFRETYLTYGSAIPPAELFRRFRGRDPNPKLLLKDMDQSFSGTIEPSTATEGVDAILVR